MNNNLFKKINAKRNAFLSALISLIFDVVVYGNKFGVEYFMGKVLDIWLNNNSDFARNLINWIFGNPLQFTVVVFLITLLVLFLYDYIKYGKANNKNDSAEVSMIPRFGKIHQDLWEKETVWLEIVGISNFDNLSAFMKKLNSDVNGRKSEHLEELTNSTFPRLRTVDEKIFVAWNNTEDSTIAVNNGKSKPIPKEINRLETTIELREGKRKIAEYNGLLVRDWSDWKWESL